MEDEGTFEDQTSNRPKSTGRRRLSIEEGECRVNRIDKLNEKIANLSGWLDHFSPSKIYSNVESDEQASGSSLLDTFVDAPSKSHLSDDTIESTTSVSKLAKAQSNKDLEKFAGVYSLKMVLLSQSANTKQDALVPSAKKSFISVSKRPMLVELHSFPGFDNDILTPLPSPLKTIDIIQSVTSAQLDLETKPTFKKKFKRFFFSDFSQAILSDTFWWYFCSKYQPLSYSQQKLFNRIAHNYTKFFIQWIGSNYQDVLFKRYPDLLAQSVYATFCHSFPTSYRQFDDKFKDDLIILIKQWITGTRPAPRTFEKWNFSELEPKDMRKGDQLYLNAFQNSKTSELEKLLDDKALGLSGNRKLSRARRASRVTRRSTPRRDTKPLLIKDSNRTVDFFYKQKPDSTPSASARVCDEKEVEEKPTGSDVSRLQDLPSIQLVSKVCKKRESCKAGRGPEFCKNVFDIYGRSPLLDQFFRSNNLALDNGLGVLIRRTEIERLPPLNAPSYDDVIKDILKSSRMLKKKYQRTIDETEIERRKISKRQVEIQKEMERQADELMANPSQVKKISDLLRLSLLRDQNEDTDLSPIDIEDQIRKAIGK